MSNSVAERKRTTRINTSEVSEAVFRLHRTGNKHQMFDGYYELSDGTEVFYKAKKVQGPHGVEMRGSTIRFDNGSIKAKTNSPLYKFLVEHPFCEGSENNEKEGRKPRWFVVDSEKAAREQVSHKERVHHLNTAIFGLKEKPERMRQVVLAMGGSVSSDAANIDFLLTQAETVPDKLEAVLDAKDLRAESAFNEALQTGVIDSTSTGFNYAGIRVGEDADDAIATLRGDTELLSKIENNLKS